MAYYRDTVTDHSWKLLTILAGQIPFILIGGWAVWLYTKALKSKDIDIIIDLTTLGKLRETYDVVKNNRLHKYEIIHGPVDVDIYVPHWSQLGLPIQAILSHREAIEQFRAPRPEILTILKQVAYSNRVGSVKGKKDLIDIVALLSLPSFDWDFYLSVLKKTDMPVINIKEILRGIVEVPELSLNRHAFSRLKKRWKLS